MSALLRGNCPLWERAQVKPGAAWGWAVGQLPARRGSARRERAWITDPVCWVAAQFPYRFKERGGERKQTGVSARAEAK